jgi:anti-sigma B factor antagonist
MEGIQVSTHVRGKYNQVSVIKVGGFIDTTTSSEVERALHSLLKQNRFNVIIDLGNVDYISSAGWGIFISEIKSIREQNGDLKLVRMIPDVYEIFELLEFHHILDVYDAVEDAVRKFEDTVAKPAEAQVAREYSEIQSSPAAASSQPSSLMEQNSEFDALKDQEVDTITDASSDAETGKDDSIATAKIEDKIKYIVAKNPDLGAYKINKILNSSNYGFAKVGWFGVRSILNSLGLNSRKNRKDFARRLSR